MPSRIVLDALDRKILNLLQSDTSLSMQEIADRVRLSVNPCWRRIKRLEREGVIERRVALLDPAKVGLGMTAFVTVRTSQHDSAWLERFASGVRQIAEIIECHRMSGEVDYLLKVAIGDIDHYDRVYKRLIALVPGLADVSSAFSMERLKYGTGLDLGTAP